MSEMPQRYDLMTSYRCGATIEEMEPADDGDWVRYADVESLLASREEENRRLKEAMRAAVKEGGLLIEENSTLRDQVGRLRELVEQWRAESKRWREDDSTPYACEWADTLDECAADLESRMDKPT